MIKYYKWPALNEEARKGAIPFLEANGINPAHVAVSWPFALIDDHQLVVNEFVPNADGKRIVTILRPGFQTKETTVELAAPPEDFGISHDQYAAPDPWPANKVHVSA